MWEQYGYTHELARRRDLQRPGYHKDGDVLRPRYDGRRGRSARLTAAHVVDFERVRAADMLFLGGTPDIDANTRPFTNHHVALNMGPTEHRGLKLAL
jgi:hypothetical protein